MRRSHYTLLELVTVIAILAVVFGVAIVGFSSLRLERSPREQAESLRRLGALCRRSAIAQGKNFTIEWRQEMRVFVFGSEKLQLAADMEVKINSKTPEADLEAMRFFPDGNAAEVTVEFLGDGEGAGVRVSPLTGLMELYETE